jgi:hypothetical protein
VGGSIRVNVIHPNQVSIQVDSKVIESRAKTTASRQKNTDE